MAQARLTIISTILFVCGFFIPTSFCQQNQHDTKTAYENHREIALKTTPQQLGISLPAGKTSVYGLIMDIGTEKGTVTVVSFKTGDATVYISNGGAMLNGKKYPAVSNAAKRLVAQAQKEITAARHTDVTPLPQKDLVTFYLLTNKGWYTATEKMSNITGSSSRWRNLFEYGNDVITQFRLAAKGH